MREENLTRLKQCLIEMETCDPYSSNHGWMDKIEACIHDIIISERDLATDEKIKIEVRAAFEKYMERFRRI